MFKIDSFFINVLLCFVLGLLWKKYHSQFEAKIPERLKSFLSLSAIFWLVLTSVLYVVSVSYFSYIEVNMALIAEAWRRGEPIFTSVDSPHRYSLLYGPWPSIMNSLFLMNGAYVIQSSKLMGLFNFLAAATAFFYTVSKASENHRQSIYALGLLCLCWLGFDNFSFVIRPDSFVIAYVVFALFALEFFGQKRPLLFFFLAGMLTGLSEACKAHGFVYFIPIAVYSWESRKAIWSWPAFLLCIFSSIAFMAFPFLLPDVSISNYLMWLHIVSKHGLSSALATGNLTYFLTLMIMIFLLGFHKSRRFTFWSIIIAAIVAGSFGSLVGAGTHHFMPFFAIFIYFLINDRVSFSKSAQLYFVCLILGLSYDAFMSQKALWKYFGDWSMQSAQLNDLKNLRASCKSGPVEIGYTDNSQMELSYFKPLFVSQGDSMLVDHSAVMDMNGSGVLIPQSTLDALQNCAVPYMILPKAGNAWKMQGFQGDVFSTNWIQKFNSLYSSEQSSEFYTLYKCKN